MVSAHLWSQASVRYTLPSSDLTLQETSFHWSKERMAGSSERMSQCIIHLGSLQLRTCHEIVQVMESAQEDEKIQVLLAIRSDKEDLYEVAFQLSADIAAFLYPFQAMTGDKVSAVKHWKQYVSTWRRVPRPLMKFMYHLFGFKVWRAILVGWASDMNVSRWRPSNIWEKAAWAKIRGRRSAGIVRDVQSASSSAADDFCRMQKSKGSLDVSNALIFKWDRAWKWG